MSLKPFVYWAQTEADIFLRVDLKQVKSPDVCIEEEELEFTARGIGAQGGDDPKTYHFVIEFFLPIDRTKSRIETTERQIQIALKKKDPNWWPRLLYEPEKMPWLKIDFDRWKSGDISESEDEDTKLRKMAGLDPQSAADITSEDAIRQRYPDVYRNLQKSEIGFISESKRKIYLFFYNLLMFVGFLYVISAMSLRYASQGEAFIPDTYATVGNAIKMLHLFMFLEVLHPFFGYTKLKDCVMETSCWQEGGPTSIDDPITATWGSMKEAIIQVGGRNFVIFALIEAEPRMQEKPVIFYLFIVYSLVELVRYPYYMFRVYDLNVGLLTWFRYTIWIPLYPAGFICEGVIFLRNIPYFEETKRFSIELPNSYNFSFHFPTLLRIYLLFVFFPVLYTMMQHMYQLRCKRLGIRQHKANRPKKED